MPKMYLRATGTNRFEWVTSLEKAGKDEKKSMEATQKEFRSAELVEVPQPQGHGSKWAIRVERIYPG